MSHLPVAQKSLNESEVSAVLGKIVAGGVPEAVRMDIEFRKSSSTGDAIEH